MWNPGQSPPAPLWACPSGRKGSLASCTCAGFESRWQPVARSVPAECVLAAGAVEAPSALTLRFRPQQAANIVRALELFVKPDGLSGENAYMCARCVPGHLTCHCCSPSAGGLPALLEDRQPVLRPELQATDTLSPVSGPRSHGAPCLQGLLSGGKQALPGPVSTAGPRCHPALR